MVGDIIADSRATSPGSRTLVIGAIYDLFPWLRHLFADSAYSGGGLDRAIAKFGHWRSQVEPSLGAGERGLEIFC
jgi:hypothetical protein